LVTFCNSYILLSLNLTMPESLFTRVPKNISPEEALARFRRLKEEDRERRQLQEVKEISQWGEKDVAKTKKD
ncbi:MAG: hypothetical protein NWS20_03095, partial [Rickettsiaceae bacterium]|nr:hypothetical protein [Rickettsiaceae bacterium]MDP5020553.1 hypothetical protein [Rickettsiaceae bacterium]